jgi:hypothetical protein
MELCLDCLNEPEGLCNRHKPKPPTIEESIAIACEYLVQRGVAKRLDNNTIKIF